MKIKICGITNLEDALAAVDAGADALGFMFYEGSPRHVGISTALSIISHLPGATAKVGVFVDAAPGLVRRTLSECALDALQFHGEESPAYCQGFPSASVIKAFRVHGPDSLAAMSEYAVSAWLLDAYVADTLGGTGVQFNWDLAFEARQLALQCRRLESGRPEKRFFAAEPPALEAGVPVILAGGLTPENVGAAVCKAHPAAVDVSSGVESSPGRKDHNKLREFVRAARLAGLRSG